MFIVRFRYLPLSTFQLNVVRQKKDGDSLERVDGSKPTWKVCLAEILDSPGWYLGLRNFLLAAALNRISTTHNFNCLDRFRYAAINVNSKYKYLSYRFYNRCLRTVNPTQKLFGVADDFVKNSNLCLRARRKGKLAWNKRTLCNRISARPRGITNLLGIKRKHQSLPKRLTAALFRFIP